MNNFKANIDSKNKIVEWFDTESEAIKKLRETVEENPSFIFMGVTNWQLSPPSWNADKYLIKRVKWGHFINGKLQIVTKSITTKY